MLTACSRYENEDVVAIVGEKEITIADVRLFYNLDRGDLEESVKAYVKEEVLVQEAKRIGLDVSREIEEERSELKSTYYIDQTKEQQHFAKKEAKKLGLALADYYERYIDRATERNAYIMALIEEKVGVVEEGEEYTEKVEKFIDGLLQKYSDDIEILVE